MGGRSLRSIWLDFSKVNGRIICQGFPLIASNFTGLSREIRLKYPLSELVFS